MKYARCERTRTRINTERGIRFAAEMWKRRDIWVGNTRAIHDSFRLIIPLERIVPAIGIIQYTYLLTHCYQGTPHAITNTNTQITRVSITYQI
jgi:hypothetical protein